MSVDPRAGGAGEHARTMSTLVVQGDADRVNNAGMGGTALVHEFFDAHPRLTDGLGDLTRTRLDFTQCHGRNPRRR